MTRESRCYKVLVHLVIVALLFGPLSMPSHAADGNRWLPPGGGHEDTAALTLSISHVQSSADLPAGGTGERWLPEPADVRPAVQAQEQSPITASDLYSGAMSGWEPRLELPIGYGGYDETAPFVIVDDAGQSHAIWSQEGSYDSRYLEYARLATGSRRWPDSLQVSDGDATTGIYGQQISTDADGNVYALWIRESNLYNDVLVVDSGAWITDVQVNVTGTVQAASLHVTPGGTVAAVWQDAEDALCATRTLTTSWGTPVQVDDAAAAVEGHGRRGKRARGLAGHVRRDDDPLSRPVRRQHRPVVHRQRSD
jgi:hypothetical protein